MTRREPSLVKSVEGQGVRYLVHWSAIRKADRHEIINTVPSVPGIYELYYRDGAGPLNLMRIARAWYGGLRHRIREETDPELAKNARSRQLLEDHDIYYRYAPVSSFADMTDLLYFFAATYLPGREHPHSGRYQDVYVEEKAPDRLVDLD